MNSYIYYRKFEEHPAINCYTGSISFLLQNEGLDIKEEDILLIGKGFSFRAGYDEYNTPLLSFDLFGTVQRFCEWYDCVIDKIPFTKQSCIDILDGILKTKDVLVWVNSKYLEYSDLYYSQRGYLHAVVLEELFEKQLVRVKDRLIVSTPPTCCEADLSVDNLIKAMSDIVTIPEGNFMGEYIIINKIGSTVSVDSLLLKTLMYENSKINLQQYNQTNRSPIYMYFLSCRQVLVGDQEEKNWMLKRMNTNIRTLYCIPNRKLIYKVLDRIGVDSNAYELLDKVIKAWDTLAYFCLKLSIKEEENQLMKLEHYFSEVEKKEFNFWKYLNDILVY